jgi:hypothetical protein
MIFPRGVPVLWPIANTKLKTMFPMWNWPGMSMLKVSTSLIDKSIIIVQSTDSKGDENGFSKL